MRKSIGAQLKAIQKKSLATAEKVVKETYFDIANDIIIATPQDQGLLIANWLGAYDAIDSTLMPIGNDASGRVKIEIDKLDITQERTLYMTNSLPYAQRIENGWSQKRPEGMVKVSVAKFDSIAQQKINKYK